MKQQYQFKYYINLWKFIASCNIFWPYIYIISIKSWGNMMIKLKLEIALIALTVVNRESESVARGSRLLMRMWLKGILVWGKSPNWTSAREQLRTNVRAPVVSLAKVLKSSQCSNRFIIINCRGLFDHFCYWNVIAESSVDDHLTMEDLISYSFQVAKGMEFLSSRKVRTWSLSAVI